MIGAGDLCGESERLGDGRSRDVCVKNADAEAGSLHGDREKRRNHGFTDTAFSADNGDHMTDRGERVGRFQEAFGLTVGTV